MPQSGPEGEPFTMSIASGSFPIEGSGGGPWAAPLDSRSGPGYSTGISVYTAFRSIPWLRRTTFAMT